MSNAGARTPLLAVEDLHYRYPDSHFGLDGVSIAFARGSRNALLGANGSGKSTLFFHANGLIRAQAGSVRFDGDEIRHDRAALGALRRRVGLVFQDAERQLFSARVGEDVAFGPLNLDLDEDTVRRRVADALAAVGLSGFDERPLHQLSHGQKKRVAIAGVLAMAPELLILDEPLAGLDHESRTSLLALLDRLHAQGITIVLSTHSVDLAYAWADHIHLIDHGRSLASFAVSELPQQQEALAAAGLPLPEVLALHRSLVARGVLATEPVPRSVAALTRLIEASGCPTAATPSAAAPSAA